jgi:hypothetical protein
LCQDNIKNADINQRTIDDLKTVFCKINISSIKHEGDISDLEDDSKRNQLMSSQNTSDKK